MDTLNKTKEYAKQNVLMILAAIVIVAFGSTYYFYGEYSALKNNSDKQVQEETAKIIAQVGTLIVLPEGEMPTMATVADPEKLKDQPFFAKAKKGDRVLIYAKAKKAILYNPESNKIVEVAPINIGNQK